MSRTTKLGPHKMVKESEPQNKLCFIIMSQKLQKVSYGNMKVKPQPKDIQNNGLIVCTLSLPLKHYTSTSLLICVTCISSFNSEYTNFNLFRIHQCQPRLCYTWFVISKLIRNHQLQKKTSQWFQKKNKLRKFQIRVP